MFEQFIKNTDDDYLDPAQKRPFEAIEPTLKRILATVGEADTRIDAWQRAVSSNELYPNPEGAEIPRYDFSSYLSDTALLPTIDPGRARRTEIYDFVRASNSHREFVNERLLQIGRAHV